MKNIKILATGGTIAGKASDLNDNQYLSSQILIDDIISNIPNIKNIANISDQQILSKGSQNMGNDDLLLVTKKVIEALEDDNIDGIVITHGTDTMEETAYFLDLTIKTINKPIIMVGSMRPSNALSSDGPMNLFNAVALATNKEAIGTGVLVVSNDKIFLARDISKTHRNNIDAFCAPNSGPLGHIYYGKIQSHKMSRIRDISDVFDINLIKDLPKVDIIYGYGSQDCGIVDYFINSGSKALVVAGVGGGNINNELIEKLILAQNKGVTVVRSSRVAEGFVLPNIEINDDQYGFIAAKDLNPQKARILAMLALTKTSKVKEVREIFNDY